MERSELWKIGPLTLTRFIEVVQESHCSPRGSQPSPRSPPRAFTGSIARSIGALGAPRRWIILRKTGPGAGLTLYRYRAELRDGTSPTFAVAIDAAGKIAGSRLLP